jgi:hypothetical protein
MQKAGWEETSMNNAPGTQGQVPVPGENERQVSILVVDDEPLIVQTLTIALTYEKFEVSVARDGLEAIYKASVTRPDLVILDWMMPNMDGIDVCRKLLLVSCAACGRQPSFAVQDQYRRPALMQDTAKVRGRLDFDVNIGFDRDRASARSIVWAGPRAAGK